MTTLEQVSLHRATSKPNRMLGVRHFQVLLTFLGTTTTYSLNSVLSVSIVAMVDKNNANPNYPTYDWSSQIQSVVLSALTWGIFILPLPGGILAEKYGPSRVITTSQLVPSILCILTPVAASGGWGVLFLCRFLQGLFTGMLTPAIQVHMAQWVPVNERGVLVTTYFAAIQLGTVLGLLAGGVLSASSSGWPSVFYWFGGLGVACTVMWMLLGSNTPAEDSYISIEERTYIENSLKTNDQGKQPSATPWKAIFTSLPFWANTIAVCGWSWGYWTLITELPTYMKTVLGFDLSANGLLSALPYLMTFFVCIACSILSDYIHNREIVTLLFSRKLFNCIGFYIPAMALIALAYSQDVTLNVILLNIAVGVSGAGAVGYSINNMDLAPNFAGTVLGLGIAISGIFSCLAPLFVGAIVTESGSVAQWQVVFLVTAGVYSSTGVFFMLFARAEQQSWNDPIVSERDALLSPAGRA